MQTLLYITASHRPDDVSVSRRIAGAFVQMVQGACPGLCVQRLHLDGAKLPYTSPAILQNWGRIGSGDALSDLAPADRENIRQMERLTAQFAAADRYVFAVPHYNQLVPYELVQYFTAVVRAETTMHFDETGCHGLLRGKKALAVYASGGPMAVDGQAVTLGDQWLRMVLAANGVTDTRVVVAENADFVGYGAGQDRLVAQKIEQCRAELEDFCRD